MNSHFRLLVPRANISNQPPASTYTHSPIPSPDRHDQSITDNRDLLTSKQIVIYLCKGAYSVVSAALQPHELQPSRLFCPWDSSGKNPGVGCHSLLQGIFLACGSNSGLLRLLHWPAPPMKPIGLCTWVFEEIEVATPPCEAGGF